MALKMAKNAVLLAILAEKTVIKGVFCKFGSCLCIFVNQKIVYEKDRFNIRAYSIGIWSGIL